MRLSRAPVRARRPFRSPAAVASASGAALEPVPGWHEWLETALLAAAAIALGAVLAARDAAVLSRPLPWLALAPLLAGLRYGSSRGVACGAVQGVALVLGARSGVAVPAPLGEIVLGWLVAGLVSGEFRGAWVRRVRHLEGRADDQRARLETLARAYHALKASHDRLERATPAAASSLREALDAFRRAVVERAEGASLDSLGEPILALFRDRAAVHAAALHPVDADGEPRAPVAVLGAVAPSEESTRDPLVRCAAHEGEVVSVRDAAARGGALVAVPLIDVAGRVHAVVAVHDVPFLALHEETLTLLAVLGGHVGDVLSRAPDDGARAGETPLAREFWSSVARATLDARRHGVPASLAVVEIDASPGDLAARRLLARHVAAQRRATDEAEVLVHGDGAPGLAVLLRLADEAGLRSAIARLGRIARERAVELGVRGAIRVHGWSLEQLSAESDPRGVQQLVLARLGGTRPAPSMEVHRGVVA